MDQYYHYPTNMELAPVEPSTLQSECDSYSCITPAIHRAVYENNAGTRLVRRRQYDAAVKSFTEVLKILKPLAALVEANENYDGPTNANTGCIPMSISFDNRTTPEPFVRNNIGSEHYTDMNASTVSFDSRDLEHTDPTSSDEVSVTTQPLSPLSPSERYWDGAVSPRSSDPGRQKRRISASTAAKLLASSSPPNKFARQKTSHFVFRDPVEIPPESVPCNISIETNGGHSSELFSKFLMIVMYNLALTLQLHALSLSNENTKGLTNANGDFTSGHSNDNNDSDDKKAKKLFLRSRKLYELAFEMHLDESCDVNLLFTLALINNLGLVYDVLGQKQRSKTCFKNMFSTMMYLMDSNESHTVKEWDGLLSNVMDILFQQQRKIAAPAA